jgi:C_GCAxxG_C_C family probable redox protein
VGEHVLGQLEPQSIRMSTAFGGGIGGSRQELCGALSGGVMVIGGLHGRTDPSQDDQLCYDLAKQYQEAFLAEFDCSQCAPIRERYQKPDGSHGCDQVVERAARILLNLLAKEAER